MNKTSIKSLQKQILSLLPEGQLIRAGILFTDSCSEVSRLACSWIKKEYPSIRVFIAKGTNINKASAHDLIVTENNQNQFYAIDPTIWQFDQKATSIFIKESESINQMLKKLETRYGGTWEIYEECYALNSKQEKEYIDIIHQNFRENI